MMNDNLGNGSNIRQAFRSQEVDSGELDLREIVSMLGQNKLFIMFCMLLCLGLAWLFTLRIPPKYESTALVQVENKADNLGINGALLSMQSGNGSNPMLSQGLSSAQPSEVETALLRSRYILQPTIEKHGLNIVARPDYFPIVGSYLARRYVASLPNGVNSIASPPPHFAQYAWGGEKIQVKQFEVPYTLLGAKFYLVAGQNNSYSLFTNSGQLVLQGVVGKLSEIQNVSKFSGTKLLVSNLFARPDTRFVLVREPDELVLQRLIKSFNIQDLGEKNETGVLSLSLQDTNRGRLPLVLNTILNIDVKNNISKKSEEAKKTLNFLNKQLPIIKGQLSLAERALQQYRARTGTLDLSAEGTALLGQIVDVEQGLEKINLQKAALLQSYTSRHPVIVGINRQRSKLNYELNLLRVKLQQLPLAEQQVISLTREVTVRNQLYLFVLSQIQQMKMIKAGIVGNVKVLDFATPPVLLPVYRDLILAGGLILGLILALIILFVKQMLSHTVDDPDLVEDYLGVPVYAIIPHSRKQEQLFRLMQRKLQAMGSYVLSNVKPRDLAVEGVRSLRTTLQFSLLEARNNVIAITGASPGVGKSFVSVNLAALFADSGKKVLLIDADLRRGKICRYLTQSAAPGMAELLEGKKQQKEVIKTIVADKLDFIATGKYPENPSEVLLQGDFKALIDDLSSQYDVVIIDTPPILAVTEGVLIAKHAAINLLMVGSGKDNLKELSHVVKRLQKSGVSLQGLVFNNTLRLSSSYGNYNYYYDYRMQSSTS